MVDLPDEPHPEDGPLFEAAARRRVRRRNIGHLEELSPGRWRKRAKGKCADGRPYDVATPVVPTPEEAERLWIEATLERQVLEYKLGLRRPYGELTLGELVVKFRRECASQWDDKKASMLRGPLRPLVRVQVRALNDSLLTRWAEKVTFRPPPGTTAPKRSPDKSKYLPGTVTNAFATLGVLCRFAFERQWIPELPFRRPRLPKNARRWERRELTPAECRALLDVAARLDDSELRDLSLRLEVLLVAALRPEDVAKLRRAELEQGDRGWVIAVPARKKGRARRNPIPAELADRLLAHWLRMPEPARDTGVFFPTRGRRGRGRWKPRARAPWQHETWVRVREGAQLPPDVDSYFLRHTALTDYGAKFGAQVAASAAGHTTQRVTERTYMHGKPERDMPDEAWLGNRTLLAGGPPKPDPDEPPPGAPVPGTSLRVVEGGIPTSRAGSRHKKSGRNPTSCAEAFSAQNPDENANSKAHGLSEPTKTDEPIQPMRGLAVGREAAEERAAIERLCARIEARGASVLAEELGGREGPARLASVAQELRELAGSEGFPDALASPLLRLASECESHARPSGVREAVETYVASTTSVDRSGDPIACFT